MSEYTDRILNYLTGKMNPSEKERFEADLLADPELKKEYQITLLTQEILVGEADLERILNDPELHEAEKLVEQWKREENKKPILFKSISWFYLSAACFAFMLIFLKFLVIPKNSEKLFLSYYETLNPTELSTPELPAELTGEFNTARGFYDAGNYPAATEAFNNLREYAPESPQILLYLGSSEIENGNTGTALKAFKKAASLDGPYIEKASFYTGLCYIRLSNPQAALIYLTEKTGLTKNLDKSLQKMIRRVNLINTFQFKQLRKEMEEDDESTPQIGPLQKKIFFGTMAFMYAFFFIAMVIIYFEKVKSLRSWLWLLFILILPFFGSIIYLLKGRSGKK